MRANEAQKGKQGMYFKISASDEVELSNLLSSVKAQTMSNVLNLVFILECFLDYRIVNITMDTISRSGDAKPDS